MRKSIILMSGALLLYASGVTQLHIQSGAKLYIQGPAVVTCSGNVSSPTAILGTGTLLMKGTSQQLLQTAANAIPNLTIDNTAGIRLNGNIRVNGVLNFVNGKIFADNYSVFLGETATTAGAGAGKFVETIGSGQLRKLLNTNVANYVLPVGSGNNYTPVAATTSGSYSAAFVAVKTKAGVHPNKPASVTNYLNNYWTVLRSGVTGSVSATATYTNANIVGNEATYAGFYWNGSAWVKTGASVNAAANQVTVPVTGTGGDVYAMNDFAMASASQLDVITNDKLFPNPTASRSTVAFNIETGGLINISVFDVKGRLLRSKQLNVAPGYQQQLIDMSGYKPGVYEVRLRSASFSKNYKLIKQ